MIHQCHNCKYFYKIPYSRKCRKIPMHLIYTNMATAPTIFFVILQFTIGNHSRIYMYICAASGFLYLQTISKKGEQCQKKKKNSTGHSISVFCFYFSMILLLTRLIFTNKDRQAVFQTTKSCNIWGLLNL